MTFRAPPCTHPPKTKCINQQTEGRLKPSVRIGTRHYIT